MSAVYYYTNRSPVVPYNIKASIDFENVPDTDR